MSNYPFSRILLATEHSEFDAGAERLAIAMAKRYALPLRVVVPMLDNVEYESEMPELVLRDELEVADKIAALRVQAEAAGVQLDVRVRRRPELHKGIVAEAIESKADLLIIRRRGKPGFLARLLIGEMVSKVIQDAPCSVLLVPRAADLWNTRILAAVGDSPAAPGIAKIAGAIAGMSGLPLTVLSVAADEESLSKTRSLNTLNVVLASGFAPNVQGELRIGKPVDETVAAVKEFAADLVVVGRQQHHRMSFGTHSTMQHIAGNMDVPILVVTI